MNPPLELTSVPPWAVCPTTPSRDETGTACSAFAVGDLAREVAEKWLADASVPSRLHAAPDVAAAVQAFDAEVAEARVGWRVLLAGNLVDVLRIRAHALAGGLTDAEIVVATTATDRLPVACAHCSTVVVVTAAIGDVVACERCERSLLVYHHVSRRKAAFLGFQVDAETWEG